MRRFLLLATLATLLLLPAAARAEQVLCLTPPTFECEAPAPAPQPAPPTPEMEREAAEVAAAKAAPVTEANVVITPPTGKSWLHPGRSTFLVETSEYAQVKVKISRAGRTATYHINEEEETSIEVGPWSCRSAGRVYHYVVEAQGGSGEPFVVIGSFRNITLKRCHHLKAVEEAKRRARQEAARRRAEAERARERQEAAEREQHEREAEDNCRRLGDRVVMLHTPAGGEAPYCVDRNGHIVGSIG